MTSIRSFSEILRGELAGRTDKSAHFAGIIHDESLRLTKLLDEILEISFLESGQPKLNVSQISVKQLIERAAAATASLVEEHQAELHLPDSDAMITTDPDRLVQPIINLIANAIKHNRGKFVVWLNIYMPQDEPFLRITVEDNGGGIPQDPDIDIFEKFATVNAGASNRGVGLGLPISAQIIKLLSILRLRTPKWCALYDFSPHHPEPQSRLQRDTETPFFLECFCYVIQHAATARFAISTIRLARYC